MVKISQNPAPLHHHQTVSEAFATLLKHHLAYLGAWETSARSWQDTEGVHQMRVTFRRMRSALGIFRPAIPKSVTERWAHEMRWFANQFGPARDLDVFIEESLSAITGKLALPGETKLIERVHRQRASAYEQVITVLDSQRYAAFKAEFNAWMDSHAWLTEDLNPKFLKRLISPVIPFGRKILDKQERRVLATGSHVDQNSPPAMHQLRIECKKLRYAAEFFMPLFSGMKDFINHMKGLQNLLGVMNDVTVMHHILAELVKEEEDADLLQYAGALVGWRTRQYYEIKDTFDESWTQFIDAKHPWWQTSTIPKQ